MGVHASVVSHEQTFYTPMDCNLPGSSVFGISQIHVWEIPEDPPPGDLPNPGIEPVSPASPALAGGFFTPEPSGKAAFRQLNPGARSLQLEKAQEP